MITAVPDRSGCTSARHGTASAYDWHGCRCADAREQWRLYRKRLRHGRQPAAIIPAVGTARRLQALVALGYSWRELAVHLGVSNRRAADIGMNTDGSVHRTTAARVKYLYDRLSGTRGTCRYAFTVAARYGFVPPLAWNNIDDPNETPDLGTDAPVVDRVVIDRALDGERVSLDSLTRHHAVHVGLARGMSETTIARHLRMSGSAVRDLAQKALPDSAYQLAA